MDRLEQLTGAATANLPEALALVRASDGVIAYTNATWSRLFGYDAGELTGRHISVVAAPPNDDVPGRRLRQIIDGLARQGVWRGDARYVGRDGAALSCATSIGQFDDPELGGIWVMIATRPRPSQP